MACYHSATLPDLQVNGGSLPAVINRRNTAKGNTGGEEERRGESDPARAAGGGYTC